MRYLLDTHIWLWAQLQPERLAVRVREALDEASAQIYLSPLSVFEAMRLAALGRVDLGPHPAQWVQRAFQSAPVREALVTFDVAVAASLLEKPPRDPVDRLLIATAAVLDLCLVTADEEILALANCRLLSNRT